MANSTKTPDQDSGDRFSPAKKSPEFDPNARFPKAEEYSRKEMLQDEADKSAKEGGFYKSGELSEKESTTTSEEPSRSFKEEARGLYKKTGGKNKKTPKKAWWKRKRTMAAGAGAVFGALLIIVPYIIRPLEFVYVAERAQASFASIELMADKRFNTMMRRYQWGGQNAYVGSRLGTIGNRVANAIETKLKSNGIELITTDATGILQGYKIDGVEYHFDGDTNRTRRIETNAAISRKTGWNRATTAIMTRLPYIRYGVNLRPMGNITRRANESIEDWLERIRQDKIDRVGDPTYDFDAVRDEIDTLENELEGLDPNDPDPDVQERILQIETELQDLRSGDLEGPLGDAREAYDAETGNETTKLQAAAKSIEGSISRASAVVTVLALSCLVDNLNNSSLTALFENIYQPAIRMAAEAQALGSQAKSGENFHIDELGVHSENLYDDSTEPGNSWVSSAAFGGPEPVPTEFKVSTHEPSTVEKWLSGLDRTLDLTGIGLLTEIQGFCSVATSSAVGWALFGAEIVAAIFSLGSSEAALQGTARISTLVIRELIEDFITGKAVSATTSYVLSAMIGKLISPLARGAIYGSIIGIGSHYAANESARSVGGRSLTEEESLALDQHLHELEIEESKQKGFAYRYFDLHNPKSLTASIAKSMSRFDLGGMGDGLRNVASTIASGLNSIFDKNTFAQTDYEGNLGAQKVSFTLDEIYTEDEMLDDPFAVEEYVVQNGLEDRFSGCFKLPVDSFREGNYDELEDFFVSPMPHINSGCDYPATDQDEHDFQIYRFYRFDLQNTLSLACLEGDDVSCTELGL